MVYFNLYPHDQLENFKRIEKKIEKCLVNPIAAFDI